MTQYIVNARYTDHQNRSHYITETVDTADRRYIQDFIRSRYPVGKQLFINSVRQNYSFSQIIYYERYYSFWRL